ncbi:putative ribonuclease H-like domain-containing protein [Tanacetum coccineum]
MAPRAVLMKTGLKSFNTARPVNTVRFSKDFDGGYVTFGRGAYGGRITGKGTIKTDNFDFDEYFVKELKFNLFSVSQMCDKKNYVLFTDSECLVLSPNFKLPDENHILLKIPRQDNMLQEILVRDLLQKDLRMTKHVCPFVIKASNTDLIVYKEFSESSTSSQQDQDNQDCIKSLKDSSLQDNGTADQQVNTARPEVNTGSREVSTVVPEVNTATPEDLVGPSPASEDTQVEDQEIELGNIPQSYALTSLPPPHTRNSQRSPNRHVIGDEEPKRVSKALSDPAWVEKAMYEEGNFLPVYRNKKDERGIVIRNKARLVAQGHTQEKGIDYNEVFALYPGLCFLYGIYGLPNGCFEDPNHPDKVYKVVKALYGLHQAPRAWYNTLANYLLCNGFQRGKIDQTLFIKRKQGHILLVQIYVDDIIFGSTKKELCDEFEKLMKDKFQMSSMGELTFFLGLQVQQKKKGIFISQDKYVHEILRKYNYTDVKSASTLTDLEKPLVQDGDAADVDEHLYRSMIGSLMYLTASRPNIMFAVCACARFQVSPKTSHLLAVKRIFRYLKGKPSLGLWYSKDSPWELVAYTDSDYAMLELHKIGSQPLEVLWIQNQLLDYGYNFMNTVIYIDNNSTICIIENPVQHSKTKHIEIRHHFIRDCNAKKLIQMAKIDTEHNVAGLLTKGFDAGIFQYLVSSIGMLNP